MKTHANNQIIFKDFISITFYTNMGYTEFRNGIKIRFAFLVIRQQ